MSSIEPFIAEDLSNLILPSSAYTVLSALQTQEYAGGDKLQDALDITFMVTGRAGVFTVQIPIGGFRVIESGIDLSSEAAIINAIYDL